VKDNPDIKLPDLDITVVRRADASGTNFVFTKHLSAISEAWAKGPGFGTTVKWAESDKIVAAPQNAGVTSTVKQTPGAIGYIEYGYAIQTNANMAMLQNKAGKYISPTAESGAAALANVKLPEDLRAWLPDPDGANSYPIATYTWMLFYKKYGSPEKAKAIRDMVAYCLVEGQKISEKMGYIPLPDNVVQVVRKALENIQ
jgi:phosphate transport system substrate-binding protein